MPIRISAILYSWIQIFHIQTKTNRNKEKETLCSITYIQLVKRDPSNVACARHTSRRFYFNISQLIYHTYRAENLSTKQLSH